MNIRQEHHEEHDRPEGVRRVLDTEDRVGVQTGPARPGGAADSAHSEPVASHAGAPGGAPDPPATTTSDGRIGLLNDVASLRDEWQRVQGTFVDDPPRAVQEASALVDRTLDEIRANVGSGHPSDTTSTEELRVTFQRYREFFQRLLSA